MNKSKMTTCKFCKAQVNENDVFCMSCGKAINLPEQEKSRNERRFFQTGWFTGLMLCIFPPIGIALLWAFHRKHKVLNSIVSIIFGFFFLLFIMSVFLPANTTENVNQGATQKDEVEIEITQEDNETSIPTMSHESVPVSASEVTEASISAPVAADVPTATSSITETQGTVAFFDFTKENDKLDFAKIIGKGYAYVSFNSTLFSKDFLEVSTNGEYKYYGELKDNKPHGSGIVWHPSNGQFSYLTIGHYEKGYLNGYAIIYCVYQTFSENAADGKNEAHHLMYKYYEGYFKDGYYEGKGNEINNPPIWDFADERLDYDTRLNKDNYKTTIKGMAINPDTPFPFVTSADFADGISAVDYYFYDTSSLFSRWDAYIGEFKDGQYNGKGNEYVAGELVFEGKYKDGNRQ